MHLYSYAQESYAGFFILLLIAGVLLWTTRRHPVSEQMRRWAGIAFMFLFLWTVSDAFVSERGEYLTRLDAIGYLVMVLVLVVCVPLTYHAKRIMMELWLSLLVGVPLARYFVNAIKQI